MLSEQVLRQHNNKSTIINKSYQQCTIPRKTLSINKQIHQTKQRTKKSIEI